MLAFSKNANPHSVNQNYIVFSNKESEKLLQKLSTVLKPLFDSEEIFQIIIKGNTLSIQINTDNHHFDLFEKLEKVINYQL